MAFLGAVPFFTAWLFLIRYHFFSYLYAAKPAYGWLWGFFNPCVFSLPQEEEKNLKKIFNASIVFDFISNYTNYIHMFITCPLFPTGYFFAVDLSTAVADPGGGHRGHVPPPPLP